MVASIAREVYKPLSIINNSTTLIPKILEVRDRDVSFQLLHKQNKTVVSEREGQAF